MAKSTCALISFIFFSLFSSCNSRSPNVNLSVYRALSSSLRQSNYEIENQIRVLLKAFDRDTSDPRTSYYAKKWQPKALSIKETSNKIFQYLDSQKVNLKIEAGIKLIDTCPGALSRNRDCKIKFLIMQIGIYAAPDSSIFFSKALKKDGFKK